MPESLYEIIALGMRWWFVLLGLLIVLRTYGWLLHDRKEKHERLKKLPDAGCIGELLVLTGNDELPQGARLPVPWQGTLGFVRGNDLVVPFDGVAYTHLDCEFEEGRGLITVPRFRCSCMVDGKEIRNEAEARRAPMLDGSVLQVGECRMQLAVFKGITVGHIIPQTEWKTKEKTAEETQDVPVSAEPESIFTADHESDSESNSEINMELSETRRRRRRRRDNHGEET